MARYNGGNNVTPQTAKGVLYEKSGLSQETLKIIACITMLIDHVGATVVESQFL